MTANLATAASAVGFSSYVAGDHAAAAVELAGKLAAEGIAANLGYLAAEARDADMARAATRQYRLLAAALADTPPGTRMEVDLPHIGLDLGPSFCLAQLTAIAACLPSGRLMQTSAEDTHRTDAVLRTVLQARAAGLALRGSVQANLRRSVTDVSRLTTAGVQLRLVKGGYAQPLAVAWPFGELTDIALVRLARTVLQAGTGLSIGTHDQVIQQALPEAEIEMLLGARPDVARSLAADGRQVRLYVPYGPDHDAYVRARITEARRHLAPAPGWSPGLVPHGGACTY